MAAYSYTTSNSSGFNVRFATFVESANERRLRQQNAVLRAALGELQAQIPRLVQLCHPDKHEQSLTATEATRWLLAMRTRLAPPSEKEAA